MTEKERAAAGRLYRADSDPQLGKERDDCKDLCYHFNACLPSDTQGQQELLRRIIGRLKGSATVTAPFWCDYGYNITMGDGFYSNHNCVILDCAPVVFGDNVLVAPNCCFSAAAHPLDSALRRAGEEYALPITVGDDVWFGAGVTVLPGVTIGSGSVIGAGSVVTRDIPPGVVAVGNPCRVLRAIAPGDRDKYLADLPY